MKNGYINILRRAIEAANGNFIQAAFFYLRANQETGRNLEKTELLTKKDEVNSLSLFAS